jgi:cytosine deaminase
MAPPRSLPSGSYLLTNGSLPGALLNGQKETPDVLARDVLIREGRIASVTAAGTGTFEGPRVDLKGGMLWPCFADLHTHIDKGHIWGRAPRGDGSFNGALQAVLTDRARWTPDEIGRRMDFALRCAFAHGTSALRTHIDSHVPDARISWEAFCDVRDRWRDRIALQAVSIAPADMLVDAGVARKIADLVAECGGVLGVSTRWVPELQTVLENAFDLAEARGLALDLHVDETGDPGSAALGMIAKIAIDRHFALPIVAGHCCSLALQSEDLVNQTLDLVAEAGLTVVSLPLLNVQLQDRQAGRTPRWRGVTLVHEMKARGIRVALGSDNVGDPLHAYGDYDLLEVYREATRICHLDAPISDWPTAVTTAPAAAMGLADRTLSPGAPADFILFTARNFSELLARPQSDRLVVRRGAVSAAVPPDFSELDAILAGDG